MKMQKQSEEETSRLLFGFRLEPMHIIEREEFRLSPKIMKKISIYGLSILGNNE